MEAISDEAGCIRRVLVAMMIADGDVDPEEVATVRSVYAKMTGQELAIDALLTEARRMQAEGATLATSIQGLAGELGPHSKQRVLAAAFAVATADGFVLDEEDQLLAEVGRALAMDDAEYKAALHELMSSQGLL